MTSERRRLLMGTAWTLTATAASLVIGVVLRPVLVFFVGVSGYGIWAAALAITSLFGLLGDVGVGAALTRLVAERKGRQADMGTFSGSALLFGIICGAASGLILATLSGSIERATAFPGLAALLMLQAIQMPVNLGTAALFGLLQGSRNFRSIAVFTISQSLGNLALAGALLVLGFGLVGVMFASLGVAAIVFIVVLAASTRTLRLGGLAALKGDLRNLLPFGAQLTATNGLSTVMYQIDLVVLSLFTADPAVVGIYALAVFATRALWIVPGSINVSTYPVISEYTAAHDARRVEAYLSTALGASVAITGALASAIILFGRPVLRFVFGPQAVAAYPLCLVLVVGTGFLGCLRAVAASLPGVGRPDVGMWLSALGALMVFGLAVVLTPLWGSVGTAVAVSISFAVIAAALLWALRRYVFSPNHARWNLRRVGITAAVSVVLSAGALLASMPEAAQPERGVLSVFSWAVGVALLAVASGGKETWSRILRRADVTGSGRV